MTAAIAYPYSRNRELSFTRVFCLFDFCDLAITVWAIANLSSNAGSVVSAPKGEMTYTRAIPAVTNTASLIQTNPNFGFMIFHPRNYL
jgi:hypothetical protein